MPDEVDELKERAEEAAHDRSLAFVQPPRRFGQPRLSTGETGTFRGKRDFKVALAGDGPQANADRALKRLGRCFLGVAALRLDVR